MANEIIVSSIREKYRAVPPFLHGKARRCWAACEALAMGRGGISTVAVATQLSRPTIRRGIGELQHGHAAPDAVPSDLARVRIPGGGRPRIAAADRTIPDDLQRLIDPATRGGPMSPLPWTCKSTRNLAEALAARGHVLSHETDAWPWWSPSDTTSSGCGWLAIHGFPVSDDARHYSGSIGSGRSSCLGAPARRPAWDQG